MDKINNRLDETEQRISSSGDLKTKVWNIKEVKRYGEVPTHI